MGADRRQAPGQQLSASCHCRACGCPLLALAWARNCTRTCTLVAHFSEQRKLSRKDIAELRKLLEELDDGKR